MIINIIHIIISPVGNMLETREERVKLLKAGLSGKTIERLYIEGNNIRIIRVPPFVKLVELDVPRDENNCRYYVAVARCV